MGRPILSTAPPMAEASHSRPPTLLGTVGEPPWAGFVAVRCQVRGGLCSPPACSELGVSGQSAWQKRGPTFTDAGLSWCPSCLMEQGRQPLCGGWVLLAHSPAPSPHVAPAGRLSYTVGERGPAPRVSRTGEQRARPFTQWLALLGATEPGFPAALASLRWVWEQSARCPSRGPGCPWRLPPSCLLSLRVPAHQLGGFLWA